MKVFAYILTTLLILLSDLEESPKNFKNKKPNMHTNRDVKPVSTKLWKQMISFDVYWPLDIAVVIGLIPLYTKNTEMAIL